jgi:phage-related baseplate assembly protein
MINDSVRIKSSFIINIGIDFDIIVLPNFINDEVLRKCISEISSYFSLSKWQINEPIILSELYVLLSQVEGVQSVKDIKIINKVGIINNYSSYAYDIEGATINGVIYPSIDPMIFELKFPNQDIKGRVVPL